MAPVALLLALLAGHAASAATCAGAPPHAWQIVAGAVVVVLLAVLLATAKLRRLRGRPPGSADDAISRRALFLTHVALGSSLLYLLVAVAMLLATWILPACPGGPYR